MADVRLTQIRKSFGAVEVIKGIDLDIPSGEFVVFVGPSGCGKSTLLRLIAGLEEISDGTLEIRGERVNEVPPDARGIAMVFQSYALYPHMSVYDNMAFGLKLARLPRSELDARVRRTAEMLQLTDYLNRRPKQLSGGQRQRVAIGRAITRDPDVFLFDEPLSNLDAALRVATRIEIANLKEAMPGTTMIYVTHDQTEAMTLADRIVVLNAGRIEQVGSPMELYHRPANVFVAQFIGSPAMNVFAVECADGRLCFPGGGAAALPTHARNAGSDLRFGIRPEHLREVEAGEAAFRGKVGNIERLGEQAIVHVEIGKGIVLVAKVDNETEARKGAEIHLGFEATHAHFFDAEDRAIAAA
ncbi:MAG: ABC transporter ATP-binding protein [Tropicimonas sp.]|uniref:ABC transporter ATP-binding protein n=1 Tax=Tropicimonas sp. TaxID=2067044 RepID=UPI003A88E044